MKRTYLIFISIIAALLLLFTSCEKKQSAKGKGEITVGVSLLTRTHPFYQDLEKGLTDAADSAGYRLLINAGEFDVARQKDQINDYTVRKVDAIIIAPCDSKSIGTSVAAANQAGIPVFTVDIACLAEGAEVLSHIASDNISGGQLAAVALAEALHNTGEIAIIDHPEVESVIQRVKGFEEELEKYPDIKIVSKLSGHGVKDQAFRTAEDILQAHPELDGIFGINDDSALGALAAVEKAGKAGKIVIVGFDAVPEARAAINEGKIYADVIQRPLVIGKTAIETITQYISGKEIPQEILIPCELYKGEK